MSFTRLKTRLNVTQIEKELKLTQTELFSFFQFVCVVANASELFFMAHLTNIERTYIEVQRT